MHGRKTQHGWRRTSPSPPAGGAVGQAIHGEQSSEMGDALPVLGHRTFDVYLNGNAFWRNVPAAVWNYRLGRYQVLKKWLSYREH